MAGSIRSAAWAASAASARTRGVRCPGRVRYQGHFRVDGSRKGEESFPIHVQHGCCIESPAAAPRATCGAVRRAAYKGKEPCLGGGEPALVRPEVVVELGSPCVGLALRIAEIRTVHHDPTRAEETRKGNRRVRDVAARHVDMRQGEPVGVEVPGKGMPACDEDRGGTCRASRGGDARSRNSVVPARFALEKMVVPVILTVDRKNGVGNDSRAQEGRKRCVGGHEQPAAAVRCATGPG